MAEKLEKIEETLDSNVSEMNDTEATSDNESQQLPQQKNGEDQITDQANSPKNRACSSSSTHLMIPEAHSEDSPSNSKAELELFRFEEVDEGKHENVPFSTAALDMLMQNVGSEIEGVGDERHKIALFNFAVRKLLQHGKSTISEDEYNKATQKLFKCRTESFSEPSTFPYSHPQNLGMPAQNPGCSEIKEVDEEGYPNTPVSRAEMERERKGKAVMTEDINDEPAYAMYQDLMEKARKFWSEKQQKSPSGPSDVSDNHPQNLHLDASSRSQKEDDDPSKIRCFALKFERKRKEGKAVMTKDDDGMYAFFWDQVENPTNPNQPESDKLQEVYDEYLKWLSARIQQRASSSDSYLKKYRKLIQKFFGKGKKRE